MAGLKLPDCLACAACCKAFGIVEITDADIQVPIELTAITELGYRRMITIGFDCICLQPDNKCSIYERRPRICHSLMRGGELCKMAIEQMGRIQGRRGITPAS